MFFKESTFSEGLSLYRESIFNNASFLFSYVLSSITPLIMVIFKITPQTAKYSNVNPNTAIAKIFKDLTISINIAN